MKTGDQRLSLCVSVDHIAHSIIKQKVIWGQEGNIYSTLQRELASLRMGNREKVICLLELVCKLKLAMILNWERQV